jgi:DNA-binding IclR family transcriptional regulator
MPKAPKSTAIASSAANVFDVLRVIAATDTPLGVSEIGRRLGLAASTVYRALITLEEAGYIARYQGSPSYELGMLPQLLNRALLTRFRLHHASRPFLQALADATGATSSVSVRLGWYCLRIAGAYGSQDIYHRDRLGETTLLHESLSGRGILAFLPAAEMQPYHHFVERHHKERLPAGGWQALDQELAEDRRRGFAIAELPVSPGFFAMALPLRDASGAAMASIVINGPIYRKGEDVSAIAAERDKLEALVRADPDLFQSPFAHLSHDDIQLQLSPPQGD